MSGSDSHSRWSLANGCNYSLCRLSIACPRARVQEPAGVFDPEAPARQTTRAVVRVNRGRLAGPVASTAVVDAIASSPTVIPRRSVPHRELPARRRAWPACLRVCSAQPHSSPPDSPQRSPNVHRFHRRLFTRGSSLAHDHRAQRTRGVPGSPCAPVLLTAKHTFHRIRVWQVPPSFVHEHPDQATAAWSVCRSPLQGHRPPPRSFRSGWPSSPCALAAHYVADNNRRRLHSLAPPSPFVTAG